MNSNSLNNIPVAEKEEKTGMSRMVDSQNVQDAVCVIETRLNPTTNHNKLQQVLLTKCMALSLKLLKNG